MPYFSESDINDAKRRVREMQNRANNFVNEESERNNEAYNIPPQSNPQKAEEEQENSKSTQNSILDFLGVGDASQLVILALILVLSREGADNMLILALLYLLL